LADTMSSHGEIKPLDKTMTERIAAPIYGTRRMRGFRTIQGGSIG